MDLPRVNQKALMHELFRAEHGTYFKLDAPIERWQLERMKNNIAKAKVRFLSGYHSEDRPRNKLVFRYIAEAMELQVALAPINDDTLSVSQVEEESDEAGDD